MIGSEFKLNKKTYVLTKGEVKGRCDECVFENTYNRDNNLCSLACHTGKDADRDRICQFFDSIFVETFPEIIKGVKKKLSL